jgi:hypothetical protein
MKYRCRYRRGGATAYERGVGRKKEVIEDSSPVLLCHVLQLLQVRADLRSSHKHRT